MAKVAITKLTPELTCLDIKLSLHFYIAVLGFKILFERPENGFYYIDREGAQLMLDAAPETGYLGNGWRTGPLERPLGRGVNFQIEARDVQALYDDVKRAEVDLFRDLETVWYRAGNEELGNKQFLVCDPDGYLLRFYQDMGSRPCVS